MMLTRIVRGKLTTSVESFLVLLVVSSKTSFSLSFENLLRDASAANVRL